MIKMYNKYLAQDMTITAEYSKLLRECSEKIVNFAKEHDYDLREAQTIATDYVSVEFSEAILRRAIDMRNQEREEKKT